MFWRTDSGSRPTSYPATRAPPEVGLNRPHSMRMVVDLPAPFGPRKPKTSPLRTSRLMRSTATKSPKRLTRLSITTELSCSGMGWRSTTDRIDEEVFNCGRDLLNRVEGNGGVLQPRLEFGDAAGAIVNHDVQAIAGPGETGDANPVL